MAGKEKQQKKPDRKSPQQTADVLRAQLGRTAEPLLDHVNAVCAALENAVNHSRAESSAAMEKARAMEEMTSQMTSPMAEVENLKEMVESVNDKATIAELAAGAARGEATKAKEAAEKAAVDADHAKSLIGGASNLVKAAQEAASEAKEAADNAEEKTTALENVLAKLKEDLIYLETTLFYVLNKLGVDLTEDDYNEIEARAQKTLASEKEG